MRSRITCPLLSVCIVLLLVLSHGSAREPKENDKDVIYSEEQIPAYDLPPLLVSSEGKPITTADEWFSIRRPQIMSLFGNLIYGTVPQPESPIQVSYRVVRSDSRFLNGAGTRREVSIRFENDKGNAEMLVLVFVPNHTQKPVPAFMKLSFNDTHGHDFDADPEHPGRFRNGWPIGDFFQRGYGFIVVYQRRLGRSQ